MSFFETTLLNGANSCRRPDSNPGHRLVAPKAWVGILASVRFSKISVMFFHLCYPSEVMEGTISIINLIMLIRKRKNYYIKNIVNCGRSYEILLTKQHVDKRPHDGIESGGTS